jgi:hypothetical protein
LSFNIAPISSLSSGEAGVAFDFRSVLRRLEVL